MRKLIFLLVLVIAACGDKPRGEAAPPPDTAGGRPDISRPDAGARVLATLTDTAIVLSHDSIPMTGVGQVTLVVRNEGTQTHNFKIEGNELGEWSAPVRGGETIFMTQLLGRGAYELLWPEDGKGQKKIFLVY